MMTDALANALGHDTVIWGCLSVAGIAYVTGKWLRVAGRNNVMVSHAGQDGV